MQPKRLGALFVLLAAVGLPAQTDTVRHASGAMRVAVMDENGSALRGAEIDLPVLDVKFTVPPEGRLLIHQVPPGTYLVQVRRLGYTPQTRIVRVRRDTTDVSFALDRNPTELDTVSVNASRTPEVRDFERRLRAGHGKFYTAKDFEKTNASVLRQFLATVPGIHLRSTSGGYAVQSPGAMGMACPSGVIVYLDGVPINALEGNDPSRSVKVLAPINLPRPASVTSSAATNQPQSGRTPAQQGTTAAALSASAAAAIPDPLRSTGALPPFDIDAINLSRIAAMEVYPDGLSQSSTTKCGAVFLWSKVKD